MLFQCQRAATIQEERMAERGGNQRRLHSPSGLRIGHPWRATGVIPAAWVLSYRCWITLLWRTL